MWLRPHSGQDIGRAEKLLQQKAAVSQFRQGHCGAKPAHIGADTLNHDVEALSIPAHTDPQGVALRGDPRGAEVFGANGVEAQRVQGPPRNIQVNESLKEIPYPKNKCCAVVGECITVLRWAT